MNHTFGLPDEHVIRHQRMIQRNLDMTRVCIYWGDQHTYMVCFRSQLIKSKRFPALCHIQMQSLYLSQVISSDLNRVWIDLLRPVITEINILIPKHDTNDGLKEKTCTRLLNKHQNNFGRRLNQPTFPFAWFLTIKRRLVYSCMLCNIHKLWPSQFICTVSYILFDTNTVCDW